MSMIRKMKRAKDGMVAKKAIKDIKTKTDIALAASAIVHRNSMRIWQFCQSYCFPMFGYVMYRHYGFGFRRLAKLDAEINHIWDLIVESRKPGGPVFHKIEWVFEGLALEAGYKYQKDSFPPIQDDSSISGMAEHLAKCSSIDIGAQVEAVWLWVLHATFGFGKKRLAQAKEYINQCAGLSYDEFMGRLREMETKCVYKHNGHEEALSFNRVRQQLAKLGVKGPEMMLQLN